MAEKTLKLLYEILIAIVIILLFAIIFVIVFFSLFEQTRITKFNELSKEINVVCKALGSVGGVHKYFLPKNHAIVQIYKTPLCNDTLFNLHLSDPKKFQQDNFNNFIKSANDYFYICLVEFQDFASISSFGLGDRNLFDTTPTNDTSQIKTNLENLCNSIGANSGSIKFIYCKPIGCKDKYLANEEGKAIRGIATSSDWTIEYFEIENTKSGLVPYLYTH